MALTIPYIPLFDPRRLRSYLLRLPLFTRIVFVLIVFFWLLEFQSVWNIIQWGALIPREVNLGTSTQLTLLIIANMHNPEADPVGHHSVPPKYLSSHPCRLPLHRLQLSCTNPPSRALRI